MSGGPLSRPQARKCTLGALVLALFLAWRGADSVYRIAGELSRLDGELLRTAVTATQEERIERALGADYPVFAAVRANVDERGIVYYFGDRGDPGDVVSFSRLKVLAYPRLLYPLTAIPATWALPRGRAVYLLDPRAGVAERDDERFVPVAAGERFRLWRVSEDEQ